MNLTIHGYSTALFSTWYAIEELGVLFDAGDGLTANLLGKSGKIKHVFISHADRDHLTGLLQYNQLFGYLKPTIYFPKDAGSFKFLQSFFEDFDPHQKGTKWVALKNETEIKTKRNIIVKAIENKHIDVKGAIKSLSYKVYEEKNKLKAEFLRLSPNELIHLKKNKGDSFIREIKRNNILTYSGDTPIYDISVYDNCEVLVHEATFLRKDEVNLKANKNKHSSLEEVMEMVSQIHVQKLILGHFSSRYDQTEIDSEIKRLIKLYNIKIPVYRIPVGACVKDILNTNTVN
ncbi:MBL fold metallo-hydrolase [Flavivirga algicola]|uniref:RNAse Z n=1 Tax=Flavivirga algicola TaxID=2729136 RepID=A0ABX1RZH0_9FLAO|nr:MBL fold metallo-hydrolase [Flavivirga algicola]NMH88977.1 RNAse Z [Flavivirga algicola]